MARVTFHGACGTVTGSMTLVEWSDSRWLVDCGMFQGDEELEARNWKPFPFDPRALDGVFLTHAHLDHCGRLPRLVAQGYEGPIHCTRPTRPLASLVLLDSAAIAEEEARYARKKGYSRHADPQPLFSERDARAALDRLEVHPFDQEFEPRPGIVARFRRAGHLLGAATLEISAKGGDGERRSWCFSGDVGRYDAPILRDPEPPLAAPATLLLESTYGDRDHPREQVAADLAAIIERTFARGGSVLVPAFALGRTQDVLYHLSQLAEDGKLDPREVFIDSPMALKATEIYRQATTEFDSELVDRVRRRANPLADDRFSRCRTVDQSKELNDRRESAVIVAASGMATGGRIVHHLAHRLPDSRNTVVFVGYQGVGTRGRALLDGAQSVSIHGQRVPVAAEIAQIQGMSAHAGQSELLRWVDALPARPPRIFLNHGEDTARKALAATLVERGHARPALPLPGTEVEW
jgi:metallo-beta-lactamase family protein